MRVSDAEAHYAAKLKAAGVAEAASEARFVIKNLNLKIGENLSSEQINFFDDYCLRRGLGEPAAYIIGRKGFYKWDFKIEKGVLIPRPETEHVVELAMKLYREPPGVVADLGCGSGIIGICLAKEWQAQVTAIDASPVATDLCLRNANALGVNHLLQVVTANVADYLPRKAFDLIVANPPYIASGDADVEPNVDKFEPHLALYAGPQGTEKIHEWSRWALKFLKPKGWWIFEIGAGQKEQVEEIILALGFVNVQFAQDLAGRDRVCGCQKP